MLTEMYNALISDEYIAQQTTGRIKYFEYPATGDVVNPYIVLDPIGPPMPVEFGDDDVIAYEQIVQLDVWSKNRKLTDTIAHKVSQVLRAHNITQSGIGPLEYDEGVFRDARRYTYKYYEDAK